MKFEKKIQLLIHKKIIPGISILVGKKDNILLNKNYGFKSITPEREILKENTIYDLASLTKPLITAFLTVYLLENEKINLNTEIGKFFKEFKPLNITISQLLTHTSGFTNWFPFYLYKQDYIKTFKCVKLEARPGKRVNYSCVGYILLCLIIEKITNTNFKDLAQDVIIKKLKLKNTFLRVPKALRNNTAPTEMGNEYEKKLSKKKYRKLSDNFKWRDYIIQGETHDANSFYLGGTAGNAGLFSTAEDIFKISLEFFPSTSTILKPESIKPFWHNFTPSKKSHRTIGFKLNSSFLSSGGKSLSKRSIGHNGFTGASIWLEPETENKFILLSNRIHPKVQNINFNRIRRRLHKLLKSDLNLQ